MPKFTLIGLVAVASICVCLTARGQESREQGATVIDASSDERFQSSLEHVKQSVPEGMREKFEQAYLMVMGDFLDHAPEMPQAESLSKLRAQFHGKTASEIVAVAEAIASRMLKEEAEYRAKVTSVPLPDAPQLTRDSLSCKGLVSTSIELAQFRPAQALQVTGTGFFKRKSDVAMPKEIEASSALGTDDLAIEVTGSILRFITRASLEVGDTSAAEFQIVKNTPEWLFATDFQEGALGASLSSFVLNKKAGLAVWTKTRPTFILGPQPDTQSHYLRCR